MFKNKNSLKGFLTILTFVIALIILVFMSAPGVKILDKTHTCLELVGGYQMDAPKIKVTTFSFLNLIPYLLLVILLVFEYLKYIFSIFDNRATRICMSVGFIVVGVMFLFGRYMVNTIEDDMPYNKLPREIGWGAIIQVTVAFICAILSAVDAIVEFEPEEEEIDNSETKAEIEDLKTAYIEEMKKLNDKNEDEQ